MNKNLDYILSLFIKGSKNFPEAECTVEDEYEKNIFLGTRPYMVAVVDKRFRSEITIKVMLPYICIDKENLSHLPQCTGYGWLELNHSDFVDNIDCSIHGASWDNFVVGFLPFEGNPEWSQDILDRINSNDTDE